MEIFDDLEAELHRIEEILSALSIAQWESPSAAVGWSVADTVLHLAQTTEAVTSTLERGSDAWNQTDGQLDQWVDEWVARERATGRDVFDRWQRACVASISALRRADPTVAVRWAAAPLRPKTLATTRLAEHWAHMLDIVGPLGIAYPDTDRLRHIAWLGHATLPYAFSLKGLPAEPIRVELVGPTGSQFNFGPPDASSLVSGSLGAFARVGAQRLTPEASGLDVSGPHAHLALSVLRNYAA